MHRLSIKPELKNLRYSNPWHILALGFGSGLSPLMPGTIGTLFAIPLYILLSSLSLSAYLFVILLGIIIGVIACDKTTKRLGIDDHSAIVWDEFIGFLITMIALPPQWQWILFGFLLFRLLDILKPPPISWIDKHVKGGIGIMLDDILAGGLSCILLQLSYHLLH